MNEPQMFIAIKRRWVPKVVWSILTPTLRWNPLKGLFARPLTRDEAYHLRSMPTDSGEPRR